MMMMFKKRHHRAIAQALAEQRPEKTWLPQRDQWESDRAAIADVFAGNSMRFNRARFLRACEKGEASG